MLRPKPLFIPLLFFCLVLNGCIYSHTVEPLMTDFDGTSAEEARSSGDVKTVTFYVSVEWDVNGIGAIARRQGIEQIDYADIETTSVLSYWRQQKVHVYGR